MNKGYLKRSLVLSVMAMLLSGVIAIAAGQVSVMPGQGPDFRALEEEGLEAAPLVNGSGNHGIIPTIDSIPPDGALLIPESTDDMVGMYDPFDGTYLGNLINGAGHFSTPINAIRGPDGNIYVSDQVADAIFVFDMTGTYLFTYADASDGLDNIRGIDFRNDTLFVTTIDPYVARFAGPHNRIPDFFAGAGAFDIHFLDDGRSLLASHASPNGVRLYDVDGTYISQLFGVSFPEQVIYDELLPGDFLSAAFTSGNRIDDFDVNGTIYQTIPWTYGRGVYRLGNGNLLATSSHSSHSGVFEVDPTTGNVIEQENSGSGFRFIELYKVDLTGVDEDTALPKGFSLGQNYPNPFNAGTNINFALPRQSDVKIEIYNLLGQKTFTLLEASLPAGNHSITWDASEVASGVYYYKLTAGDYSAIRMMTLLK